MSRRRYRGQKASPMPSDSGMMAGTLADLSAKQMGNNEVYWNLYKTHPGVRACVNLIANAVAQEGFDIVPVDETEDPHAEDPRVKQLFEFFSQAWIGRFNTPRKAFKVLTTDQQTFGCAYVRKKYGQQDGKKTIVALERLDARYVIPHLSQDKSQIDYFVLVPTKPDVSGAVQQAAQQMSSINGNAGERLDPKEIIMLSSDDGGDAVLPSPSKLEALDLTCAIDINIRKHRNGFFENGATFGNVLCNLEATDDQVRELQKKLTLHHTSSRRAYKNIAIGGDWKLLNLMQGGKHEIDFVKGSVLTIEEIMSVYGIPPGKLRDVAGGLGQAGKEADDETFEQECVLPIEECLYETLTLEILKNEFEIDDLRMVPARRNKLRLERFTAAMNLVKFGGTGNEARDMVNLPKSDVPGMDIPLFLGATKGDVAGDEPVSLADRQAAAEAATGGQPQQAGDVTTSDEQESAPENTTVDKKPARGGKPAKKGKVLMAATAPGWY